MHVDAARAERRDLDDDATGVGGNAGGERRTREPRNGHGRADANLGSDAAAWR